MEESLPSSAGLRSDKCIEPPSKLVTMISELHRVIKSRKDHQFNSVKDTKYRQIPLSLTRLEASPYREQTVADRSMQSMLRAKNT